jgi:hypothetical protein
MTRVPATVRGGLGWQLSVPSITRKTDKGLPRYAADPEDVFIPSGTEDLVLVLDDHEGRWQRRPGRRVVDGREYLVQRYRPRVESLFSRIERWTEPATGEVRWRSITRDNVTTLYGTSPESRIADPADPTRVFRWLICDSYDDTGNAIRYEYKAEDSHGVDTAQRHERTVPLPGEARTGTSSGSATATGFPGSCSPIWPRPSGCSRSCSTTASTTRTGPRRASWCHGCAGPIRSPPTGLGSRCELTASASGS